MNIDLDKHKLMAVVLTLLPPPASIVDTQAWRHRRL